MKELVFITGNQHKADYLAKWLGLPVEHQKIDLDEIQSLDSHEVAEHKVRQAYQQVQKPVLIEDVAMTFTAMGRLPGTLIKWFLGELKVDGLCRLADGLATREAVVSITYALFDGSQTHYFEASVTGKIAPEPRGALGFGWNAIFIPNGTDKTYAEMTDEELNPFSHRSKAIEKLRDYLTNS
jgi:non-canonical purine NTP pyrophosphatase (RdgB/HAM1 family)